MQDDGNFVLYGPSGALWSTPTYGGQSNRVAVMQTDGNFVIYGPSGAIWAANTTDVSGVSLVVQNDSNLVLYAPGGIPLWDRHSGLVGAGKTIGWAKSYLGTNDYSQQCLGFVTNAWASAGINLRKWANIGANTFPQDVWGHLAAGAVTGTGSPPAGALAFFNQTGSHDGHTQQSGYYSHVELSLGGGNMISTSDNTSVDPGWGNVHFETRSQHAASGAWNSYVGWWLP